MQVLSLIPSLGSFGGPPRSTSTKTWVHVLFGMSAIDCGAIAIYHFILKNYATSFGTGILLVPLGVGYYHTGSSRTIEQLNNAYSQLNEELGNSIPEIQGAVKTAQEMLGNSQEGFQDLTKSLTLLSKVLELLPVRLNENPRAHIALDHSLSTLQRANNIIDNADNV